MPAAARKIALTDRSLKAMKPAPDGSRQTVWDAMMPGLCVRVSGKAPRTSTWSAAALAATSPTWTMLGGYPVMTLAEARAAAREALVALAAGRRSGDARRGEAKGERGDEGKHLRRGRRAFIKRHVAGLRTARMTAGTIRRELMPVLGRAADRGHQPQRHDKAGRSDPRSRRPKTRGGNAAPARRPVRGAARPGRRPRPVQLGGWPRPHRREPVRPDKGGGAARLAGSARSGADRRGAAAGVGRRGGDALPFGPLVRLLILTGQRRDEIAGARWAEIAPDLSVLTVAPSRMKAKIANAVPMTGAAVAILRALPRFTAGDFVFSGQTGAQPFSGFSKAKARLDKAIGDIAPYTLHDLRRTVRTRLAELGVTPFIGELVLAHTQKGVHGIYDTHRYSAEKRDALERWEARLLSLVAPEPEPNVIKMPARKRA